MREVLKKYNFTKEANIYDLIEPTEARVKEVMGVNGEI